jgi:hypothetical protein
MTITDTAIYTIFRALVKEVRSNSLMVQYLKVEFDSFSVLKRSNCSVKNCSCLLIKFSASISETIRNSSLKSIISSCLVSKLRSTRLFRVYLRVCSAIVTSISNTDTVIRKTKICSTVKKAFFGIKNMR